MQLGDLGEEGYAAFFVDLFACGDDTGGAALSLVLLGLGVVLLLGAFGLSLARRTR